MFWRKKEAGTKNDAARQNTLDALSPGLNGLTYLSMHSDKLSDVLNNAVKKAPTANDAWKIIDKEIIDMGRDILMFLESDHFSYDMLIVRTRILRLMDTIQATRYKLVPPNNRGPKRLYQSGSAKDPEPKTLHESGFPMHHFNELYNLLTNLSFDNKSKEQVTSAVEKINTERDSVQVQFSTQYLTCLLCGKRISR